MIKLFGVINQSTTRISVEKKPCHNEQLLFYIGEENAVGPVALSVTLDLYMARKFAKELQEQIDRQTKILEDKFDMKENARKSKI